MENVISHGMGDEGYAIGLNARTRTLLDMDMSYCMC